MRPFSLVTRKSYLDELKLRAPTLDKPWTADEFEAALKAAKASGKFKYALDLGTAWTGEWYPYAFSPFLQSLGEISSIARPTRRPKARSMATPPSPGQVVAAFVHRRYAQATQDPADRDNGSTRASMPFSWKRQLGGPRDSQGVRRCDVSAGARFWQGSQDRRGVLAVRCLGQIGSSGRRVQVHRVRAAGQVSRRVLERHRPDPATTTAAQSVDNYKPGGPLAVFFDYSNKEGLVRPVTPGYVVESKVFEKAAADIAKGADVEGALDARSTRSMPTSRRTRATATNAFLPGWGPASVGSRLLSSARRRVLASKFTRSNSAGWLMSGPRYFLIGLFVIVPFLVCNRLSFTDQRLVSPNPAQWIGGANYQQLLGVNVLTLQPELDSSGNVVLDRIRPTKYPAIPASRAATPTTRNMRDAGVVQLAGRQRTGLPARAGRRLHAGDRQHLHLRSGGGAGAGRPGLGFLRSSSNQRLSGINLFRAIYFMPVVVSIVVGLAALALHL